MGPRRPTALLALLVAASSVTSVAAYMGMVPPLAALGCLRAQSRGIMQGPGRTRHRAARLVCMSGEVGTARGMMGRGISALEQRLAGMGLVNDLVPAVIMVEPIFVAVATQMQQQGILSADAPLSSVAMEVRAKVAGHLAETRVGRFEAPTNDAVMAAISTCFSVVITHLAPILGGLSEESFRPDSGTSCGGITVCSVGPLVWSTKPVADDGFDPLLASVEGEGLLSEEISERFARARSVSSAVRWMSAASLQASLGMVRASTLAETDVEGGQGQEGGHKVPPADDVSPPADDVSRQDKGAVEERATSGLSAKEASAAGARRGRRYVLIDASTYMIKSYNNNSRMPRADTAPTGAVYGFCKLLAEMAAEDPEARVVACFTAPGPTARGTLFDGYKAKHPPLQPQLSSQYGMLGEALTAFGVPSVEANSYEADDIICGYCAQAEEEGAEAIVVPGSLLLSQVVTAKVSLYDPLKGTRMGPGEVEGRFGVPPSLCGDVIALMGDAIDGIPGASSIGVKTAAKLVLQFGSLDGLLGSVGAITSVKTRQAVERSRKDIVLSRGLAGLRGDAPVPRLVDVAFGTRDPTAVADFCNRQGWPPGNLGW